MATRRMISHRVVSSAHFKRMPVSSQALYFHLCLNADDDGVVEAWPIMQIGGFAEDDIKVLVAKELVKVLNEDLVTYVLDWREHNSIRADHKVDSMYKKLLLKVVPDADLVEPIPRSDVKDNTARLSGGKGGLSTGSPRTSHGLYSIGKVSGGEVSSVHAGESPKAGDKHFDEVYQILNAFGPVNAHADQLEGNPVQYAAADRLVKTHGVAHVLKVVGILPATNKMPYVTTITTPVQLEMKWSELEAHLTKQHKIIISNQKEIIT